MLVEFNNESKKCFFLSKSFFKYDSDINIEGLTFTSFLKLQDVESIKNNEIKYNRLFLNFF